MRARLVAAVLGGAVVAACLPPQEDPTYVKDLRVLGLTFEPPEVVIPGCDPQLLFGLAAALDGGTVTVDPQTLLRLLPVALTPVRFSALLADPQGNGRALDYRLLACARTGDRLCDNEGEYVELSTGQTADGQLDLTVLPAAQFLDGGTPLVVDVIQYDTFKGLGGIRVPVVLDLANPGTGERIYAQKLMVYTCQFFPSQQANVTPRVPGLMWKGEAWPANEVRVAEGKDPVAIEPMDFSTLEESYVVPSLLLTPVPLVESWKLNWLTTFGTFSSYETGGTDLTGSTGRHRVRWVPPADATQAKDFSIFVVARDGRGGQSWVRREVSWKP